jgi:tRNA modification GTPase
MSLAHPPNEADTIAALSTPPGVGAIAVVRLSGPGARTIADRVFCGGEELTKAKSQTVLHGFAVNQTGERLDEVLAAVFLAPKTYTGEDIVELSCHGGPLPAALVLDAVLLAGARAAGPGEFTKRAFLSGRLDLSQAEAVAEIVEARSRAGLKAALSQLGGSLSSRVRCLRERLIDVLAELEARLDFSEDVEGSIAAEAIGETVRDVRAELGAMLQSASLGRLVREGARVVIAGRPNVGKSSLLNAIVGRDRAIVTPVPGTTRDTVEDWVELGGVLLTLADTAGLRSPGDVIEAEGVRRTREVLHESQLVLAVLEMPSLPTSQDLRLIRELADEAPVIPVVNKIDLKGDAGKWAEALSGISSFGKRPSTDGKSSRAGESPPSGTQPPAEKSVTADGEKSYVDESVPAEEASIEKQSFPVLPCALVSARTGDGVAGLKGRLVEALCGSEGSLEAYGDEVLLTNVRHVDAPRRPHEALDRTQKGIVEGLSEELLAFEIGQALQAMGEISGESVTEDVLDKIFARFCVGK